MATFGGGVERFVQPGPGEHPRRSQRDGDPDHERRGSGPGPSTFSAFFGIFTHFRHFWRFSAFPVKIISEIRRIITTSVHTNL